MIVVNCRFLTQTPTGVQRFAEEIAEALTALRDDLVFVSPPGDLRRHELGGVPVRQIGSLTGHLWEQWDLPRFMRKQTRPATLLSLMNTGPVFLRAQVVTHHDVTYIRYPQTYSLGFRTAYRALSAMTLARARQIVTVSEFSRSEITKAYGVHGRKIAVVNNAAGAQFAPGDSPAADPPYFLAVASLLPHKNLDFLVRAYLAFAHETGSPTVLKLVGSRLAMSGRQAARSGDDPRVQWLGRVSDDELIDLYRGARGLVFPSLYEGFGVPPLEAQACGCPVISSDAASLREVLGASALFFAPDEPEQLVRAMVAVDNDLALRARLRDAGHANAQRFSWASSARRVSALLDEMGTS